MRRLGPFWTVLLLALTGCQQAPRFVNHERPAWTVHFAAFENVGCPADQHGQRICEPDSPMAALGCDRIREPTSLLGALEPAYPVPLCLIDPWRQAQGPTEEQQSIMDEGTYVYATGCLAPTFVRYIVLRDGQFRLLATEEELRATFAPIASPDEALSYTLALTGRSARYGQEYNRNLDYSAEMIEDTHVTASGDGYTTHLFRYQLCGCGPHPTIAESYRITRDGDVDRLSATAVFRDPEEDDLCVD